jgi:hypothetical protein
VDREGQREREGKKIGRRRRRPEQEREGEEQEQEERRAEQERSRAAPRRGKGGEPAGSTLGAGQAWERMEGRPWQRSRE